MILPMVESLFAEMVPTCAMAAPLTGLTFATPCVYLIEALADDVPFARRELRVIAKASAAAYPSALASS